MAGIDLREIVFRAHLQGDDSDTPSLFPTAGASTVIISLAGIKYRAKEIGDGED